MKAFKHFKQFLMDSLSRSMKRVKLAWNTIYYIPLSKRYPTKQYIFNLSLQYTQKCIWL